VYLKSSDSPIIAQFGIYTDPIQYDATGAKIVTKAPRVIFLIGNYGVLHIMLLDLFHQIHPVKKK
jgi:hypothetical protein